MEQYFKIKGNTQTGGEEMTTIKKKIIACQIFTEELLAVLPEEYRDIDITWLDAGLHSNLEMKKCLSFMS